MDTLTRTPPSTSRTTSRSTARRVLAATWRIVRELAWGIDAGTRVRHGIEVPDDHPARRRPR